MDKVAHMFFTLYPYETAQYLTLALYLSYYCLLRVSELCALLWQHLNWVAQHLTLYLGITKGDQQARNPYVNTKEPSLLKIITHIHSIHNPNPLTPVIPFTPAQLNYACNRHSMN